jgi:hypothetical protein
MRRSILPSGLLFVLALLVACSERPPAAKYSHPGWDTLHVEGWTIQAPEGFEVQYTQGIDSQPGNIISASDSMEIHFDVWNEPDAGYDECNNDMLIENIESSLDWCEEFYLVGTQHNVWLDTINGRYAVLSRPVRAGNGTVSIHFSECHHSVSLSAIDLTKEQEELVLEMFATMDWRNDGTTR